MSTSTSENRYRIVAALIGAIAVIVAAIITIGWPDLRELLRNKSEVDNLIGAWQGEFRSNDTGPWGILLTISSRCEIGRNCGTVEFSSADQSLCTGRVIITSIDKTRFGFNVEDLIGDCLPVDYQYVESIDQDTIIYVVGWSNIEARGTLRRVP